MKRYTKLKFVTNLIEKIFEDLFESESEDFSPDVFDDHHHERYWMRTTSSPVTTASGSVWYSGKRRGCALKRDCLKRTATMSRTPHCRIFCQHPACKLYKRKPG